MTTTRPTAEERRELRRGWTTGACATAATKAAFQRLLTGTAPDPVEISLPKGERPAFALALDDAGDGWAKAGIVKDAGDDPDVTHGALIISRVCRAPSGNGIRFHAGDGIGTVTKPGLPLPPGEAAINPVPRRMMQAVVTELAQRFNAPIDVDIEISVPGGEALAAKTWNPRLGILGGISILGTTGVVHPYSCSAWIHSIHRGIDVARAEGLPRIAGATGSTSEAAVQKLYGLPDAAMIDMGDFVGGMLKYVRNHPIPDVVVAGGFAKMCKLAQGVLDLHSARSQVDFAWLASRCSGLGAADSMLADIRTANTAAEVLSHCQRADIDIAGAIARLARDTALKTLAGASVDVTTIVVDRAGNIIAKAP